MPVSRAQSLSLALVSGVFLAALPAQAVTINSFDFTPADIVFNPGGEFDFDSDSLFDDFLIDAQTGGAGLLAGLGGEVDGSFTFDTLGSVATTGGTVSIDDGGGDTLTGVLDLQTIEFDEGVTQTVTLNGTLTFNPTYTGGNSDLFSLASEGALYSLSTDFIYTGLSTLQALFDGGNAAGALEFSLGNATVVPEPRSLAFLGMGLIGIGLFVRKKSQGQPNRRKQSIRPSSFTYGTELAS